MKNNTFFQFNQTVVQKIKYSKTLNQFYPFVISSTFALPIYPNECINIIS